MPALFLIPVLGVAAAIAYAMWHHSEPAVHAAAGPPALRFELDRGMPEAFVHQVLAALVHGRDPTQLDALARECDARYPLSATHLRERAAALRASSPPATSAPPSTPTPPTSLPTTPSPHGASIPVTPPATPSAAPPRAPAPSVSPPATASPASPPLPFSLPSVTSSLTDIAAAAMRALTQEQDPVTLEGFAATIRTLLPDVAAHLTQRAEALRAGHASVPPVPPQGVPFSPPPIPLPASAATMSTPGAPMPPSPTLGAPAAGAPTNGAHP